MPDLLPPHVLAALGGLDFVSRRVVSGAFAGIHRATLLGAGREFDRHRAYQQGDESRHVDWRLFARTDRLFVRQFREESNLQAFLLVDDSASMAYAGGDGLSKLHYARMLGAALAHLMLRRGDAVGLARTRRGGELLLRPRNRKGHLHDLLIALERIRTSGAGEGVRVAPGAGARDGGAGVPDGGADVPDGGARVPDGGAADAVERVASALPRRGRLVFLSDMLAPDTLERTVPALARLRARGDEVVVARPITPEEEGRAPLPAARYFDPDDPGAEIVAAPADDPGFRARVADYYAALGRSLRERGVEFLAVATDMPVERALTAWLTSRAAGAA